jgi:RimJ/RimL family protein N-acetyltransferase
LGWDVVFEHLKHDGIFGFRMIPTDRIGAVEERLEQAGFGIDFWDVFTGSAPDILEATDNLILTIPDELEPVPEDQFGNTEVMHSIQECMVRSGVVPFSGRMLSGNATLSHLTALRDSEGKIVATAFGYLPHNRFSPHEKSAWAGLVSVDESWRGMRLGVTVNALAVRACLEKLDAHTVYEMVSETNLASRRMVERCGLTFNHFYKSGIARSAGGRFTT